MLLKPAVVFMNLSPGFFSSFKLKKTFTDLCHGGHWHYYPFIILSGRLERREGTLLYLGQLFNTSTLNSETENRRWQKQEVLPGARLTIVLYTELDAECNQQMT